MVYEWKYPLKVDAQSAGDELARIENKFGELTPEKVVDESRDENAVLHPCFEWNDAIAAELYRREQARHIISNITVTIESPAITEGGKITVTRAFVDVSESVKGKFVNIKTALNNDDYKRRILLNAKTELLCFEAKYSAYRELCGVCNEIDNFIATFESDENND